MIVNQHKNHREIWMDENYRYLHKYNNRKSSDVRNRDVCAKGAICANLAGICSWKGGFIIQALVHRITGMWNACAIPRKT